MPRFPTRALAAIFSTAVGLAFVFSFKTPDAPPVVRSNPGTNPNPATTARPRPTGQITGNTGGTGGSRTPATGALRDGTVTGQLEDMRFGPVQVQVTIASGQITDVTALQLPSGGRSGRISSFAEPALRSEVLSAQSANIDIVSGATYTSEAYVQSLQSALDQLRG
ncbi:MAG TPA: FMN-binding protein [Candidatus Limnocylindrales bacterium]